MSSRAGAPLAKLSAIATWGAKVAAEFANEVAKMSALQSMVSDSVKELTGLLLEASKEAEGGDAFAIGRKMGLLEALSLLQQQARAFGIPLAELSLPEEDIETL